MVKEYLLQDQALKKNWHEYFNIMNRQIFFWAKTGDFDRYIKAVLKYNISTFNRVKVTYNKV